MSLESIVTTENIMKAAIIISSLTFFLMIIISKVKSGNVGLETLIIRASAAGTIPGSIVIVLSAYDLTLLSKLTGFFQLQIAFAGLVLIYVSWNTIFAPFNNKY